MTKPPTMNVPRETLVDDQRGAIMLTGLFMACFLIGSLWFLVGIGDAIVFRDKMQEAADVGAFSAAALQAKGMNLIALCNLVMLVGTVIHIVLGVISDVKWAEMVYACIETLLIGCPFALADAYSTWNTWNNYFKGMSKGFKAIHGLQEVAAYVYPAAGVAAAYENGATYGGDARTSAVTVLAVSASFVPGARSSKKEGMLPVEPKTYGDLCSKVVSFATNGGVNLLGVGKSLGGFSGKGFDWFNKTVGGALELAFCNDIDAWGVPPLAPGWDKFWGEDGPYVVWEKAKNGNNYMQTWAINFGPKLIDASESRVAMAGGPRSFSKYSTKEGSLAYIAQAEMYVDCEGAWDSTDCNRNDQATFTIKWRARLRRFDVEALGNAAAGAAIDHLFDSAAATAFKEALPGKVADLLHSPGFARGGIEKLVEKFVSEGEDYAKTHAKDAAGNPINSGVTRARLTSYH